MRKAFANTKIASGLDGSMLDLTVHQNGFFIGFASQDAFMKDAGPQHIALRRAAESLFALAELKFEARELY